MSAGAAYKRVVAALEARDARRVGPNWACPAHADRTPSLTVTEGRNGALVHCKAGCPTERVVAALGLGMADLFDDKATNGNGRRILETYPYVDENGVLLYEVLRYSPKTFRPRLPDGTPDMGGARRVLYRLPKVLEQARQGGRLYVVEGERDVEAVERAGGVATTNPGGAGKWGSAYSQALKGADVVIVADRDEPGRRHAQQVAASLTGIAARVQIVEAAAGKDAADHLRAGHTLDELAAPKPGIEDRGWLDGAPMDPAAVAAEPLPVLAGFPFAHRGNGVLISGPTGGGRSSLVQACTYDAALEGLRCAYLGSEVTEPEFNARAADLAKRRGDPVTDELRETLTLARYLNLASVIAEAWKDPARWVATVTDRYDVVVIDPLSAVASALDLNFDNSNAEFIVFYDRLVQPLTTAGVTVVLLENVGHSAEARARAKGASAKADRADLTLSCRLQASPPALVITAQKVRTVRAAFQRGAAWTFYRDTQRVEGLADEGAHEAAAAFRPTVLMERVSAALHKHPGLSRRAIREAVKGKAATVDLARELLISEGFIEVRQDGQADRHYPVKPFQDTPETPTVSPVSQPCPDRVPDTVRETVSHRVPPPVGGDTGTRTRHGGASDKPTVSRQDADGQAHVDRAIDLLDAREER